MELFKYRSWQNPFHKRILSAREIYFPSSSEFNDPFDSSYAINYDNCSNLEIKYDLDAHLRKKGLNREKRRDHYRSKGKLSELRKSLPIANLAAIESTYGIFSLSTKMNDILMWSHYADNHKGICVGFDSEYLCKKDEFIIPIGSEMQLCKVKYSDDYPKISPKDIYYLHKMLVTKASNWSYEEEYRLILFRGAKSKIALSAKAFTRVIIGCKFPEDQIQSILGALRTGNINIEIYKCEKSNNQFMLQVVKLN